MSSLLVGIALLLTACVQDSIVFEQFGTVTVDVDVPEPLSAAGIRVHLSGTGELVGDNDLAFTNTDGKATIRTQRGGQFSYVVATHEDYQITYGGDVQSLGTVFGEACKNVQFKGRIQLPGPDDTVAVNFLFPGTGLPPLFPDPRLIVCLGDTAPQRLAMRPKRAGFARFVFFREDSRQIINSFACSRPVPGGSVFVTGSFNNFNMDFNDTVNGPIELVDDGCLNEEVNSGDDFAQDGAFTRVIAVESGEVSYVFLANTIPLPLRDPYEERSKRVRVLIHTPDRTSAGVGGIREIREIVASVMTVKDSNIPLVDREPNPKPPNPNDSPDNFQGNPDTTE